MRSDSLSSNERSGTSETDEPSAIYFLPQLLRVERGGAEEIKLEFKRFSAI
ncbi:MULTISPECIES: hypothetical protein [unclassified Bradyrhizobium]